MLGVKATYDRYGAYQPWSFHKNVDSSLIDVCGDSQLSLRAGLSSEAVEEDGWMGCCSYAWGVMCCT